MKSGPEHSRLVKYRYTKFIGDELGDLDLEDLVAKLSDLLLSSGFGSPYAMDDADRTMQALHDAILDALFNGGVLPEETLERLLGDPADADQSEARSKLEELIQQIIERMTEEGYITAAPDLEPSANVARVAAAPEPTLRNRPRYLPLLFMGEEYGETTPFPYLISHSDPALIDAVRRGRRMEFAAFEWQGEMPDPQDETTFLSAKLRHELRAGGTAPNSAGILSRSDPA